MGTIRNPDGRVKVLNGPNDPIPVALADFTGDIDITLPGTIDVSDRPDRQLGEVSLTAGVLAALETIHAIVDNWPADYPDSAATALLTAVAASLVAIQTAVEGVLTVTGPLTDTELRAAPVTVDAVDLDVRDLTFATDTVDVSGSTVTVAEPVTVDTTLDLASVRQTGRAMAAFSEARTGPLTDDLLIAGDVRLLRVALHVDPEAGDSTFPVVTIKQGGTVIYSDKLEAGLAWSEWSCFEEPGDVTLDLSTSATVYLNLRYEAA